MFFEALQKLSNVLRKGNDNDETGTFTKGYKSKIQGNNTKSLRSIDRRTRRDRIINDILRGVRIQNLVTGLE
jgi:hypothetical protein